MIGGKTPEVNRCGFGNSRDYNSSLARDCTQRWVRRNRKCTPGTYTVVATHAASRLRELVVPWGGESISGFTFSAGIAVAPDDGATQAELMSAADRALYHAKAQGRERVVLAGTPDDRPDGEG